MTTNGSKRLHTVLLVGATMAMALVAALTVWAVQLGGGSWLPLLAPFGLVLAVPLAALAWLGTDQNIEEPFQAPSDSAQDPTARLDREPAPHTSRRVA
jgi:hypothetical protein